MVSKEVERSARPGSVTSIVPDVVIRETQMAYGLVGEPGDVRKELDRIQAALHPLYAMEPDQAMRHLIAFSSRLTEMARMLFRLEITDRKYTKLRTMDVMPLLDEIDRQFKVHSRLLEARAQDLALEGIRR